jgi:uncharacterized protein (DUF608 family)
MPKSTLAWNPDWPVLRAYDHRHLRRIALPLGGIGTGTVSLGGRGDLRDWELANRPAKGFNPAGPRGAGAFFALYTRTADGATVSRALEAPIDEADFEGSSGCPVPNHGLPRFRNARFGAAYPLAQILLTDPDVPLRVRLEAFNPLIPGDSEASSLPFAFFRFVLSNPTARPVQASVAATLTNFIGADGSNSGIGWDGSEDVYAAVKDNRNEFRRRDGLQGIFCRSEGVDPKADAWGTMALATTATAGVTARTAWANLSWGDSLLDFWDDFSADGRLEERDRADLKNPKGSIAVRLRVPPRASRAVTFLLAWHFPNRRTWTVAKPEDTAAAGACACGEGACDPNWIGNYYTARFADAWAAAAHVRPLLASLEKRTTAFVRAFCASDLPAEAKEAALFNVSTLRSQTCFRTPDGYLFGWEGCHDRSGCCHGSCTHVWNYEQATAFLFGDLARGMREVEFLHATDEKGLMSFRVSLPLSRPSWKAAAADGQLGCLVKLYREWQLHGDDAWLRRLWPAARRALEFCWIPGGWDADRDGVMEGCQHNTMDVEYFGPNPQMMTWYLAALRAGAAMAAHVGEADFAAECRRLAHAGGAWMDTHLFNGEYYEHEVRPAAGDDAVAPGLRIGMGAADVRDPQLQLGAGCLVDQLVGQFLAHVCGLGHLTDPAHVRATLAAILRHNFRTDFHGHFNHMRSYVLNGESALLMASYPRGRRPKRPFPYYTEVMTGFEYAAAIGMLYEGMTREGLRCIRAIRNRYDGLKRNPFNEAECGHHYARAMAAWGAVLALTGFHYSAVTRALSFRAAAGRKPQTWFWSTGSAWGACRQLRTADGLELTLDVAEGELTLERVSLAGFGDLALPRPRTVRPARPLHVRVKAHTQNLEP